MGQESMLLSSAVAMFLYAEGIPFPRRRNWWRLLQEADAPAALITALINLPYLLSAPLPRPVEEIRILASAGRLLIACLLLLPEPIGLEMALNPWRYTVESKDIAEDQEQLEAWREGLLLPILTFVQSDLVDACSSDCDRVTGNNPHEPEYVSTRDFWRMLDGSDSEQKDGTIIIETSYGPCTVGLDMKSGCPLIASNEYTYEQILRSVQAVLHFRRDNPEGMAAGVDLDPAGGKVTFLLRQGMSWTTLPVEDGDTE
jgi:hypothetical protein